MRSYNASRYNRPKYVYQISLPRVMAGTIFLVARTALGCQGSEEASKGSDAECYTILDDLNQVVVASKTHSGSCNQNSDCSLVTPELVCESAGVNASTCPVSLSAAGVDFLNSQLGGLQTKRCQTFCGIMIDVDCPSLVARCIEGSCQSIGDRDW